MRLHRSAARLALSLPLAGLGPVRSPGKCFLRPILKRLGASKQTAWEVQTGGQVWHSSVSRGVADKLLISQCLLPIPYEDWETTAPSAAARGQSLAQVALPAVQWMGRLETVLIAQRS